MCAGEFPAEKCNRPIVLSYNRTQLFGGCIGVYVKGLCEVWIGQYHLFSDGLFDVNPTAKVSFLPYFCGWTSSLHILPLGLRDGLAFHYASPTCHGNIVPSQGSALTP